MLLFFQYQHPKEGQMLFLLIPLVLISFTLLFIGGISYTARSVPERSTFHQMIAGLWLTLAGFVVILFMILGGTLGMMRGAIPIVILGIVIGGATLVGVTRHYRLSYPSDTNDNKTP